MVENAFHLVRRTMRHSPPDMTKTIHKLMSWLHDTRPHEFTAGRSAHFIIEDKIAAGFHVTQKKGWMITPGEEDEPVETTSADLVD